MPFANTIAPSTGLFAIDSTHQRPSFPPASAVEWLDTAWWQSSAYSRVQHDAALSRSMPIEGHKMRTILEHATYVLGSADDHYLDLSHRRDRIPPEWRRMIDEAIAEGRVKYLPISPPEVVVTGVWKKPKNKAQQSISTMCGNSMRFQRQRMRKEADRGHD